MRTVILLLCSLALTSAQAATIVVGPQATIKRIADAARIAKDGDTVEIMPGEYRADVAVWTQARLVIRGLGEGPVLTAAGASAEGKAIWVIRNGDFQIHNITFQGTRVADGNGAGIRFERGKLLVADCRFIDNQNGILTANYADAELHIQNSLFGQAPRQTTPPPHLLYVGKIARFTMSGSRFYQGYSGHLVKSRARLNDIYYNLIYDGPNGEASYEIDLPNGGISYLVGNVIGQSARTQNPAVVSYGAEGGAWPDSALYLSHNTVLSERPSGTAFLRVWRDRVPQTAEFKAINNLTVGSGTFTLSGSGTFTGNKTATYDTLRNPGALDFKLKPEALPRYYTSAPTVRARGRTLMPNAEFLLPAGTRALKPPARWASGAFQTSD